MWLSNLTSHLGQKPDTVTMKQSALWSTIGTPTLLVSVGLAHAYPNYFCMTMMYSLKLLFQCYC